MAVHEADAYALLDAKARQDNGWIEVRILHDRRPETFALVVVTQHGMKWKEFEHGGELRAAEELLDYLPFR